MTTVISPARTVAAETLERLDEDGDAFSAETLSRSLSERSLSGPDARLATTIVYGVLRNTLLLDEQFRDCLKTGIGELNPVFRILFRMAAFQHFFLTQIPAYAIGNETVELARTLARAKPAQAGFVNAVAKRIVRMEKLRVPAGNDVSALSIRYSHPEWLVRLFLKKFGPENAERILENSNLEPPLTLRTNLLRISRSELATRLDGLGIPTETTGLAECLKVSRSGLGAALIGSDAFTSGLFYLQDEASMRVAHLVKPQAGEQLLDLCAAPGGKTTHLAELAGGKAEIVCTDISTARLALVRENIERLGTPGITVAEWNTIMPDTESSVGGFDAVLVDAPCSGIGTMQRNPEIRWRVSRTGLSRHGARQRVLLEKASRLARPGGRIVYSTCSVADEENGRVVDWFLKNHPGWRIIRQETTWPDHPEMDGFEAFLLTDSAGTPTVS